jgi:hypothetical protein
MFIITSQQRLRALLGETVLFRFTFFIVCYISFLFFIFLLPPSASMIIFFLLIPSPISQDSSRFGRLDRAFCLFQDVLLFKSFASGLRRQTHNKQMKKKKKIIS